MKSVLIFVLSLSLIFVSVAQLAAQETTQTSEDQKIEALKKRQQELKRQIREELEKQNKALEEELEQLRRANVTAGRPASPISSQPETSQTSVIENQTSSSSGSNGAGTAAPDSGAATATQNSPSVNNPILANNPITTTNPILANNPLTSNNPSPANPEAISGSQTTACALVLATPNQYSRAERDLCGLAQAIVDRRIFKVAPSGIDPTREDIGFLLTVVLAQMIRATPNLLPVNAAIKSFVVDVEAGRTDKQLGADSRASGTTSLGVKGGIPQVLSWGVENGAAVASRDGTTVTFRVNPVGFVEALSSQGYITSFRRTEEDALSRFFRRTSLGFSFDTTRGTNPPTLIGSKQQLSAVSFRYQFVNKRDPRHQDYRQKWDDFFSREGLAFTSEQTSQLMRLQHGDVAGAFKNTTLQGWLNTTNTALNGTKITASEATKNAAMDEVRTIIEQQLQQLPAAEIEKDFELTDALVKFIGAYDPYRKRKKEIMDEIAKGTVVTFEYSNYREPTAPDLSNFRFIAEKGTLGGIDFTANASLTFFNKRPVGPGVKRIRDFDFSAQLDKRFEDVMGMGPATLSFTGKFQRLTSNAVAFDGTVLPNTKGDIAAGQIKLTIPIKDSGIKVPFSFTFANRTELVRERETRGNFGFTFDLDTLFARFKSFAPN